MHLHTYRSGMEIPPFTFFIQSKGLHSGRPMHIARANCFICSCESHEEKDFYFWLCFGLWKAKVLHPLLCGSVIPFIHIGDMRIQLQRQAGQLDPAAYIATIRKMILLEEKAKAVRDQVTLMMQLQVSLIRQHMQR